MKKYFRTLLAILMAALMFVTMIACGENVEPGTDGSQDETNTEQNDTTPEKKSDIVFTVSPETVVLGKWETVDLNVSLTVGGNPIDITKIEFSSNDRNIARVNSNGRITGASYGTTKIVARYENETREVTVTVEPEKVAKLTEENVDVLLGGEKRLTAHVYSGGEIVTSAKVEWSSSDNSVATVSEGLVKAVGKGKAKIIVKYGDSTDTAVVNVVEETNADNVNSFNEEYINIFGRHYKSGNRLKLHHAANAIEVGIIGTSLDVNVGTTGTSYMRVWVDGVENEDRIKVVGSEDNRYVVADGLEYGYHRVRIVKATEMQNAVWTVSSFTADKFATVPEKSDMKIEFIGDSITAGYGSLGPQGAAWSVDNSDSTKSYAYLTAHKLNADYSIVAWSGICVKANVWVSDKNMLTLYPKLADGQGAYAFDFCPNVVVLNLGTNDATNLTSDFAGSGYGEQFPADYKTMLALIREKNPDAYIICLYGMMGTDNVIDGGIKTAIKELNDPDIVYNPISIVKNADGANGHPGATAQNSWATALANYISKL